MVEQTTAVFASISGMMLFLNIHQAVKDRDIRGVSLVTLWFFTTYAAWMVFYFWYLDQTWVIIPAVINFIANAGYLILAIIYKRRSI